MELLALVNRLFKITCQLIPTAHYEAFPPNILDYRKVFNPEPIALTLDTYPIYAQVFDLKYGFIPELSVLDLLFNEGPKGIDVLNKLFTTS